MCTGCEIERKYLVEAGKIPVDLLDGPCERLRQGYVAVSRDGNEVRLRRKGDRYFLTVKSRGGRMRREGEVEISREQFELLWPFTQERVVEKLRYRIEYKGATIELDLYSGRHEGLITAEVEFASVEESERFSAPDWFGEEVTEDPRYKNESLALHGVPDRPCAGQ